TSSTSSLFYNAGQPSTHQQRRHVQLQQIQRPPITSQCLDPAAAHNRTHHHGRLHVSVQRRPASAHNILARRQICPFDLSPCQDVVGGRRAALDGDVEATMAMGSVMGCRWILRMLTITWHASVQHRSAPSSSSVSSIEPATICQPIDAHGQHAQHLTHPGVLPTFINPSSPARNQPPQIAPKSDSHPIQHPFSVHGHDPKQQTHLHQIYPFRSQQNPPGS
ncbi:hypothetical protein ACLOJK_022583, partial [Asimina triloba]